MRPRKGDSQRETEIQNETETDKLGDTGGEKYNHKQIYKKRQR